MRIKRKTKNRIRINCLYKLQSKRPQVFTFPSAAPMLWFHSGLRLLCPCGDNPSGGLLHLEGLGFSGRGSWRVWRGVRPGGVEMVEIYYIHGYIRTRKE